MSWCGGGEMRPTPGVEYRVLAIHGYTFWPGSWPPSPGLAPWAILIWRSSALVRYSEVTPNRPEATCLTAERVHRDRQGFVGLGRDRSVAHGARREPLDDLRHRLDLVDRHRFPFPEP